MEKITIKDIARLAGVSVATVSYIINGKHENRYTPDTKRKVLQIVNLYNFHPSRLAQSFALSKSRNVIVLTDKHSSIMQKAESYDFLRIFCKTFERLGYNLIMRTHLENTRIDVADAIICVGMEEEKFRRLRWTERSTTNCFIRSIRISDTFYKREKRLTGRTILRWRLWICTTGR